MFEEHTLLSRKPSKRRLESPLRQKAWIGDAVLALFVRKTLLKNAKSICYIPNESKYLNNITLKKCFDLSGTNFEAEIYDLYETGQYDKIQERVNELIEFVENEHVLKL